MEILLRNYDLFNDIGVLDMATGSVHRQSGRPGRFDGVFVEGTESTSVLYWLGDVLYFQVGSRRVPVNERSLVSISRHGSQEWEASVASDNLSIAFRYRAPGLQQLIDEDPTFHANDYDDFNIGVLLRELAMGTRWRRWLRPIDDPNI